MYCYLHEYCNKLISCVGMIDMRLVKDKKRKDLGYARSHVLDEWQTERSSTVQPCKSHSRIFLEGISGNVEVSNRVPFSSSSCLSLTVFYFLFLTLWCVHCGVLSLYLLHDSCAASSVG